MRRRHLLALAILALVVVTVLAVGPVRVWDALTLRTVEEYHDDGTRHRRYQVRWWSKPVFENSAASVTQWDADGRKTQEYTADSSGDGFFRAWARDGRLLVYFATEDHLTFAGVRSVLSSTDDGPYGVEWQDRYVDGEVVETRSSPPWFTEQEILRSVEWVEE